MARPKTYCKFEGCDKPTHAMGWCMTHHYQWRHYKTTWPIGQKREDRKVKIPKMNDGYSLERYCPVCARTVDWKQYHMNLQMCADCHRASLRDEEDGPVYDISNLLADIERFCS